jgi:hypothetical protein
VISSGVYASGALAEGNPPVRGLPAGEQQRAVGSENHEE